MNFNNDENEERGLVIITYGGFFQRVWLHAQKSDTLVIQSTYQAQTIFDRAPQQGNNSPQICNAKDGPTLTPRTGCGSFKRRRFFKGEQIEP